MNEHAPERRDEQSVDEQAADASVEQPAAPDGAAAEIDVEALRGELDDARDKYLRLAAELDNVRKRAEREVQNAHQRGIERFAQALLPVIDSFEAGLNAEHLELDTLLEGQRATLRLLEQAFEGAGIERVDPTGEPFDPELHEAMSLLASPTAEPDSVIDVIQKGYTLHSRLLRPARVIVAKAPESSDS